MIVFCLVDSGGKIVSIHTTYKGAMKAQEEYWDLTYIDEHEVETT